MNRARILLLSFLLVALVCTPVLTGCGATPTPTTVPTQAATAVPATQVPATKAPTALPPTAVPPTPTKAPAVGGTFVYLHTQDPDTLDVSVTPGGVYCYNIISLLGATLVAFAPSGAIVPWLAESWTASSDGLTWEFRLRKGVKFHDGAPLTAADFAWTFMRDVDPATMSAAAGSLLAQMDKAVAVDDYTLRLTLKAPFFPLLTNLAETFLQPLEKAAVEKGGELYGRSPVGVGPFKFKEWTTGSKVVLERNPDYTWAPAFAHQGPAYIQNIEFLIISETATQVAGMEAGEIDLGGVLAKDLPRFQDTSKYQVFKSAAQGLSPYISFNVTKPPFDDVRVRQAFNMAFDREAMIKVILLGNGVVQYGPLSPSVSGYYPGVEKIGYKFDLAKAKDLMKQAGFVAGADGMLTKPDGTPFELALTTTDYEAFIKLAQMAQEQLKALGVSVKINQEEIGVMVEDVMKGNYEIATFGVGYSEADLMYLMFHSSQIGANNSSKVSDPALDKILEQTRSETDPVKRQAACDAAQQYIVEKAYVAPLFAAQEFTILNARVKGVVFSEKTAKLYLHDAYIETK